LPLEEWGEEAMGEGPSIAGTKTRPHSREPTHTDKARTIQSEGRREAVESG